MKKNTKILIAAGICVALLAGVFAFVLTLPSQKEDVVYTPDNTILLFDKKSLVPEDITVKQSDSEYQLLAYTYTHTQSSSSASSKASEQSSNPIVNPDDGEEDEEEINVIYTMQEYEQENLSKDMTDKLNKACRYLTATRIVDQSGRKDKEYGLDKPRAEIRIVFNDGSVTGFRIGSETTDKSSSYLRMDGSKNVCLVKNEDTEIFFKSKLQMLDTKITGTKPDDFVLESISCGGSADSEGFTVIPNSYKLSSGEYTLEKPYRAACSYSKVKNIVSGIFSLSASEVITVDASEKDLISYGLDKPYSTIDLLYSGGSITLLMSEKDSSGYCYLTNKLKKKVFRIEAAILDSFYGISLKDVLTESLLFPDQSMIESMEINDGKTQPTFVFNHERKITENYMENIVTTVSYLNRKIDMGNISQYINNLQAIVRTDSAPDSLDGCRDIYSITFHFTDTDLIDKLSFYKTPDNKTFAVVNGRIACYVDDKLVERLISQTSSLTQNDTIEPFTDKSSGSDAD